MDLDKYLAFSLRAEKCLFRIIFPHEVTESYIIGLSAQKRYLINTNKKISLPEQSNYVARILESPDDLLIGLFVEGELVGTSGIQTFAEPCQEGISNDASYATMGVFVFDPSDRGKGYGKTMIWAGVYLLNSTLKMGIFRAGMEKQNIPSFRTFFSCGFRKYEEVGSTFKLSLMIDQLKKPAFITDISVSSLSQK
jgi:hypothetical protein